MGSRFELTAVGISDTVAWEAINRGIAEIQRIEKLISSWDSESQTSKINAMAGIQEVPVSPELSQLIYRSKKISALTEGSFDISSASVMNLWQFDKEEHAVLDSTLAQRAKLRINWHNIIVNRESSTVYLQQRGMRIGFGGIGKGLRCQQGKVHYVSYERHFGRFGQCRGWFDCVGQQHARAPLENTNCAARQ